MVFQQFVCLLSCLRHAYLPTLFCSFYSKNLKPMMKKSYQGEDVRCRMDRRQTAHSNDSQMAASPNAEKLQRRLFSNPMDSSLFSNIMVCCMQLLSILILLDRKGLLKKIGSSPELDATGGNAPSFMVVAASVCFRLLRFVVFSNCNLLNLKSS